MSTKFDFSHSAVIAALDSFFAVAAGAESKDGQSVRQPGVHLFTPFTPDRSPFLLHKGKQLANGLNAIASVSVFASDDAGNVNRIGIIERVPQPQTDGGNSWWSVPILQYDTPEQAQEAARVGLEMGLPIAYCPELGQDNEDAEATVNTAFAMERPQRGIPGFGEARKRLAARENCVILAAPSGVEDDVDSLWGNPRSNRSGGSTGGQTVTSGTTNGGEVEI